LGEVGVTRDFSGGNRVFHLENNRFGKPKIGNKIILLNIKIIIINTKKT